MSRYLVVLFVLTGLADSKPAVAASLADYQWHELGRAVFKHFYPRTSAAGYAAACDQREMSEALLPRNDEVRDFVASWVRSNKNKVPKDVSEARIAVAGNLEFVLQKQYALGVAGGVQLTLGTLEQTVKEQFCVRALARAEQKLEALNGG